MANQPGAAGIYEYLDGVEGHPSEYFVTDDQGSVDYLDPVAFDESSLEGYFARNDMAVFIGVDPGGNYYLMNNTDPDPERVGRQWTDVYYYGQTEPTVSPGGAAIPLSDSNWNFSVSSRGERAVREMQAGHTYQRFSIHRGAANPPSLGPKK